MYRQVRCKYDWILNDCNKKRSCYCNKSEEKELRKEKLMKISESRL
jgi:hypothetical protein